MTTWSLETCIDDDESLLRRTYLTGSPEEVGEGRGGRGGGGGRGVEEGVGVGRAGDWDGGGRESGRGWEEDGRALGGSRDVVGGSWGVVALQVGSYPPHRFRGVHP